MDWRVLTEPYGLFRLAVWEGLICDVEDFCDAIYISSTIDAVSANDTFNVGAKIYTTMREDYQAVLDRDVCCLIVHQSPWRARDS